MAEILYIPEVIMDWNRDGKVDKKDAWIYHNALKPKSDGTNEGEGSGSTLKNIH